MATQTQGYSEAEEILGNDVLTMNKYYTEWRLCLNVGKTEVSVFHLNNHLAKKEQNIIVNNTRLRYNKEPIYLGNKLDRSLTHKARLEDLSQKLKSRNNLLRKVGGTLRTSALSLGYSTAEFSALVRYRSAHVDKIDARNDEDNKRFSAIHTPPLVKRVVKYCSTSLEKRKSCAQRIGKMYTTSKLNHHPNKNRPPKSSSSPISFKKPDLEGFNVMDTPSSTDRSNTGRTVLSVKTSIS